MEFIVAYDIAHPRRLQRVCRRLERHAVRCQKSVFRLTGDHEHVQRVLDELTPLLNIKEDSVQAWRIVDESKNTTLARGITAPHRPCAVVSTGKQSLLASEVRA